MENLCVGILNCLTSTTHLVSRFKRQHRNSISPFEHQPPLIDAHRPIDFLV